MCWEGVLRGWAAQPGKQAGSHPRGCCDSTSDLPIGFPDGAYSGGGWLAAGPRRVGSGPAGGGGRIIRAVMPADRCTRRPRALPMTWTTAELAVECGREVARRKIAYRDLAFRAPVSRRRPRTTTREGGPQCYLMFSVSVSSCAGEAMDLAFVSAPAESGGSRERPRSRPSGIPVSAPRYACDMSSRVVVLGGRQEGIRSSPAGPRMKRIEKGNSARAGGAEDIG